MVRVDNLSLTTDTADAPPPIHDCFDSLAHSRGHFYSANRLFQRGVWIGYFAPTRQHESFRGLLSFDDLKTNYNECTPPYPPVVQGTAKDNRDAVCRDCFEQEASVISLTEIQFVSRSVSNGKTFPSVVWGS